MYYEIHKLNVQTKELTDKEVEEFDNELTGFFKKYQIEYIQASTVGYDGVFDE